jgi:hypothetical protein
MPVLPPTETLHPVDAKIANNGDPRRSDSQLLDFLQQELALSASSIAIALRHNKQDPGPLPMILWKYGLVSLEQLEQIFDWLES